jgi:hypothetical protein
LSPLIKSSDLWQQKLQIQNEISAPNATFTKAVFTRQFKRKLPSAKPEKNLQKKLHRNLDAATPIRFTMTNCNKLKKYARSRSTKKP